MYPDRPLVKPGSDSEGVFRLVISGLRLRLYRDPRVRAFVYERVSPLPLEHGDAAGLNQGPYAHQGGPYRRTGGRHENGGPWPGLLQVLASTGQIFAAFSVEKTRPHFGLPPSTPEGGRKY